MKRPIEKIKELSFEIIAGIDDATKCPCIGSIFISGVVATPKIIRSWKKLGVKDSKLIAAKKRAHLEKIIKETALCYAIAEITPAMIDDKTHNLNDWEMLIVLKVIQELQKQITVQTVLIDNWEVTEEHFKKRFATLFDLAAKQPQFSHDITINCSQLTNLSLVAQHYADENYVVVGAASILSKQSSDKQYAEYKQQFGDFGSGSPADPKTRLFVWQHRKNPPHIVRTSWKTFTTIASLERIEDDPMHGRTLSKQKNVYL
jgi:ribonuclease HII